MCPAKQPVARGDRLSAGAGVSDSGIEIVLAFLAIWVVTIVGISWLSGWKSLARVYPENALPAGGETFRFQTCRMRYGARYGSCVTFGADTRGLHLSVLFLFRFGHPPLFIPWSEVSASGGPGPGVTLKFLRVPDVPLTVGRQLAEDIAAASGGNFRPSHRA
jgi:hypothetical protein